MVESDQISLESPSESIQGLGSIDYFEHTFQELKTFNYKKRYLFSGPHLIGVLFIVAGLFALVSPLLLGSNSPIERILAVGTGAILLGLLIASSYDGILIDFSRKRYKVYSSIGGYKTGEWSTLPDLEKIKATSISYISTNVPNGVSPTLSGKVTDYKVFLYSNISKPFLTFTYHKRSTAVRDAKKLASVLAVDLQLNIPEK